MRIIQTLYLDGGTQPPLAQPMGFISAEFNWMSWALSCLQLKKYYDRVELYTNQAGYSVLIEQLGLPYDRVHLLPEGLNFPGQLWAYPKLYTYSIQEEPFIHVDGDVFFWEKMSGALLDQPLIAQNEEVNAPYYAGLAHHMRHHGLELPGAISRQLNSEIGLQAYNAGVIGGHDLAFLRDYAIIAMRFIEQNSETLVAKGQSEYNMLIEQVLFHALALERNTRVSCYLADRVTDMTYPGFAEFSGISYQTKFIHLMGAFKKNALICEQLALRLQNNHPAYFEKVLTGCRQARLKLSFHYALPSSPPDKNWGYRELLEKKNFQTTDLAFNDPERFAAAIFTTNAELSYPERPNAGQASIHSALDRSIRQVSCDELDGPLLAYLDKGAGFAALLDHLAGHFDPEEVLSGYPELSSLILLRLKRCCDLNLVLVSC